MVQLTPTTKLCQQGSQETGRKIFEIRKGLWAGKAGRSFATTAPTCKVGDQFNKQGPKGDIIFKRGVEKNTDK